MTPITFSAERVSSFLPFRDLSVKTIPKISCALAAPFHEISTVVHSRVLPTEKVIVGYPVKLFQKVGQNRRVFFRPFPAKGSIIISFDNRMCFKALLRIPDPDVMALVGLSA
jgi:hypothetical protein